MGSSFFTNFAIQKHRRFCEVRIANFVENIAQVVVLVKK